MKSKLNKDRIKILIAYHKPAELLKSDIFVPIWVGRSVAMQKTKDGNLSEKDEQWMVENLIGDNSGDNISDLNRYFNEMTAIYWGWKNQITLENPEYIGLMHYRRHFIFNSEEPRSHKTWLPCSSVYKYNTMNEAYKKLLDENCLIKLCSQFDILCSKKYDANNLGDGCLYKGCKQRFAEVSKCSSVYYEKMEQIVRDKYPQYEKYVSELAEKPEHYLCNMFVMKKELFNEYCQFVFEVLFKLYSEFNKEQANIWQMRGIGFLSEFLTSIFISAYKDNNSTKVKELDLTYLEKEKSLKVVTYKIFNIFPVCQIKQKAGKTVFSILGVHCLQIKRKTDNSMVRYNLFGIPVLKKKMKYR